MIYVLPSIKFVRFQDIKEVSYVENIFGIGHISHDHCTQSN